MSELADYIVQARASGLLDDQIRDQLRGAGWDAGAVSTAFADLGASLPPPPAPVPAATLAGEKAREAARQREIDRQVEEIRARRRPSASARSTSPVGGVIFALIGVALIGLSGFLYVKERDLQERGILTRGTVARIESRTRTEDDDGYRRTVEEYRAIYEFQDEDGASHAFASPAWSNVNTRKVGEAVEVLYDPLEPRNVRIAGGTPYIFAIMMTVTGVFTAIFGAAAAIVNARKKRAAADTA